MKIIPRLIDLIRREPAMVLGLAAAVLTLAASFGLNLGDRQQAAIMAVVQIVVGLIVRSQVTPTSSLPPAA